MVRTSTAEEQANSEGKHRELSERRAVPPKKISGVYEQEGRGVMETGLRSRAARAVRWSDGKTTGWRRGGVFDKARVLYGRVLGGPPRENAQSKAMT